MSVQCCPKLCCVLWVITCTCVLLERREIKGSSDLFVSRLRMKTELSEPSSNTPSDCLAVTALPRQSDLRVEGLLLADGVAAPMYPGRPAVAVVFHPPLWSVIISYANASL